jgi:hypothetical protein
MLVAEKSRRPIGTAAASTGTKRKWQPHSSKRIHARRELLEVDLTDTMTNAKIDAFFGPLDLNLNAANSTRFTGNFELGKDNPKDTEACQ